MKKGVLSIVLSTALLMLLVGCGGGGGGSDGGSGTASMNVADAKPALPLEAIKHVFVTFDEVSVHKAGGDWINLPLAQEHTIDLYQFSDGEKTQLVPPVILESGKYTQIRLGVTGGEIVYNADNIGQDDTIQLVVPSENLKTAQSFDFEVPDGGAVDLTVDFDLSRSIVVDPQDSTYKLKPVLHVVVTEEAATIRGRILTSDFGSDEATVTVYYDANGDDQADPDELYTTVTVAKAGTADTPFSIFWLVPNPEKPYIVEIEFDGNPTTSPDYREVVDPSNLGNGETWPLNGDKAIELLP
jgi:hypothetical protein